MPLTDGINWKSALRTYAPLIGWIALIFFFSSGAASASQTSRFIRPILLFIFPSASEATLLQYHFFIRKCAHLTEYALLAFWAVRAGAKFPYSRVRNNRYIVAVAIVLIVASLDEFNQSFEPSRTSTPWDVALDLVGGSTMAIFLKLTGTWRWTRRGRTEPDAG